MRHRCSLSAVLNIGLLLTVSARALICGDGFCELDLRIQKGTSPQVASCTFRDPSSCRTMVRISCVGAMLNRGSIRFSCQSMCPNRASISFGLRRLNRPQSAILWQSTSITSNKKRITETPIDRCLIYYRVSSEEQARDGHSLLTQIEDCRARASPRGWAIDGQYRDILTGSNPDGPAYQQLLEEARYLRA